MKRGEIWVLRDEGYASKPRPVVVIPELPKKFALKHRHG